MHNASSLKVKVLSSIIITGIVPLLIMSILVVHFYTSTINDQIIPMIDSNVESLSLNLSLRLSNYQALLSECAQNPTIETIASNNHFLEYSKRSDYGKIEGVLESTNYSSRIEYPFRCILYCKDGTVFSNFGYFPDGADGTKERIENRSYFSSFMNTGLVSMHAGMEENLFRYGNEFQFDFARNVIHDGLSNGILIFSVSPRYFDSLIENIEFSDGTEIWLFDGDGNNRYSWNRTGDWHTTAEAVTGYLSLADQKHTLVDDTVISVKSLGFSTDRKSWYLVCSTPITNTLQKRNRIVLLICTFSILILCLALSLARQIQKNYLEPIEYYSRYVRDLDLGCLGRLPEKSGSDEVLVLGEGLENMVKRLNENLSEIEKKETELRRQEMTTLAAQINPHFIRNTLNSIRLSAEMSEAPMVAEQIQSFTKLIDHIFHADRMSTVSDELSYLEEYMKLQNLRYQNKFVFHTDVEESLLELSVPVMIFQPIIENSVVHGFSGRKGRGIITLQGQIKEGRAVFIITDNGSGVGNSRVIQPGSSHGVTNVDRRIRLLYGEDYGISAENGTNGGTVVTVILPFKEVSHA